MTTHVLVTNFGPDLLDVSTRDPANPEDKPRFVGSLGVQAHATFLVYKHQDLIITERKE